MDVQITPIEGDKIEKYNDLVMEEERVPRSRFGKIGCALKTMFADSLQDVKEYNVREDDVWIITAPKCGTTWTQEMVWLILNNFDFERAKKEHLMLRSPYLELSRLMSETIRREHMHDIDTIELSGWLPSPRCIKSHLPKELLPEQLWTKKPKIVYVAREPKDAAVSFYYHEKLLTGYKGEKDLYFDLFYEDLLTYGPLWEHILEFWKMRDEPNILFNTYEEMKQDLPAVIRRTAKFLEKTITEEQVTALAEHLDFKQMKNNRALNIEDSLAKMREAGTISEDQAFIRKGVTGEGKLEMTPEMVEKFDERTRRVFNSEVGCPWSKL